MPEVTSYLLRVSEVVAETGDACSVVFAPTEEQAGRLDYRPGQFLTVRVPSERSGSIARCYSLSSSPYTDDALQVTVKRTQDGYASHWICDNVAPDSEVEVLAPAGVFTPASLDEDLLLFAAGSGITPVISIVKSVLAKGQGRIALVYANRDERSVIFGAELRELATAHPGRLTVVHWLESVQGLPTEDQLRELAAPFTDREAFVCGPRPFMKATTAALKALEVPRNRVHTEKFVSLGGNPFEDARVAVSDAEAGPETGQDAEAPEDSGAPVTLDVELDGEQYAYSWPRQTKLLDFLLEQGLDAPYSCRQGQCSACACRIQSGEVKMLHNEILDSDDIEEGIVLACQSLPITDEVSVTYE